MSHAATNWAMRQRGIKPATKIVLWHLADCHNPAHGCFPTQAYLADACEMSRSTVNLHLDILEEMGLIRRDQEIDERTKRHLPTRYYLIFDPDEPVSGNHTRTQDAGGKAQDVVRSVSGNHTRSVSEKREKPCPKNAKSRVRNPDTNLVREPVIEPVTTTTGEPEPQAEAGSFFDRVLVAADLNPHDIPSRYWMPPAAEVEVGKWLQIAPAVLSEDAIIRCVVEERKRFPDKPNGPKAFEGAIRRLAAALAAPVPVPSPTKSFQAAKAASEREAKVRRWKRLAAGK